MRLLGAVLSSPRLTQNQGEVRTNNASEVIYRDAAPEVVFIRNGYFMENWATAVPTIQSPTPHFYSTVTPADYKMPMVHILTFYKVHD